MKRRRVDNASDAVARRLHAVVDEQLEDALAREKACDSCGRVTDLRFSPSHSANFCTTCFGRENGTGIRCLLGDHDGCEVGGWCDCECHSERAA